MNLVVKAAVAQPVLQYDAVDVAGTAIRIVAFSGVVSLGSAEQQQVLVRTLGVGMPGIPVGFYVPEAFPVPTAGAIVIVEAAPTTIIVQSNSQLPLAYGIAAVAGQLVPSDQVAGQGWPFLSFECQAPMAALTVQYRFTVTFPR